MKKQCTCCHEVVDSSTAKFIGNMQVDEFVIRLYNCLNCGSTVSIPNPEDKQIPEVNND